MRIGIAWSGGIDSTYRLTKFLMETTFDIHVFHTRLINFEGRDEAESRALAKMRIPLRILSKRNFTETPEIIHDYRSLGEDAPYDMQVVLADMGAVAKSQKLRGFPIDEWTIGTHKKEGHWQTRWDAIEPIGKGFSWPQDYPTFTLGHFPLATKREEIDYLSSLGLAKDCWFCRRPKIIDGHFTECGECITCKEVAQALL